MCFATKALNGRGATLLSTLLLLVLALTPIYSFGQDSTFTARLSGSSEVAPVATQASGNVTAELSGDQLTVTGSFSDLSSSYAASHIHAGLAGENGGIEIGLNPTLNNGETGGTFDETFTLDAEQRALIHERALYVNVHSEKYPAGELRGQLLLEADAHYQATLTGGSAVPSVNTTAMGQLVAEQHGDSLWISGSFSGLESSTVENGQQIRIGLAGQTGTEIFALQAGDSEDNTAGTWAISENRFELTSNQVTTLDERRLYAQVDTENHPDGAIRGQVAPRADAYFEAVLTAAAEVPSVHSEASGRLFAELRDDTLFVSGSFENLDSAYTASHLHKGLAGQSGEVLIPLDSEMDNQSDTDSTWLVANNTYELANFQDSDSLLWDRALYANVHSKKYAAGEIRGQLLPLAQLYFQGSLSGLNAVEPDTTSAYGGVVGELRDSVLVVSGSFADLQGDFASDVAGGAHLHAGSAGETGDIAYHLTTDTEAYTEANARSGAFLASQNMITVASDSISTLRQGNFYANVHTEYRTDGELRSQLLLSPNFAPDSTQITAPEDSSLVAVEGVGSTEFTAEWNAASDSNSTNEVVYIWQLSNSATFEEDSLLVNTNVGSSTQATVTFDELVTLLDSANVALDGSAVWYHRVIASDGSNQSSPSDPSAAEFKRGEVTTGTEGPQELPAEFALKGNYPNPFNPVTTIQFDLPVAADVTVEIFDMIGRKVMSIPTRQMSPGANRSIQVDASSIASGLYLYRVRAEMAQDTRMETGKMILVK